jgi:hypothetical protein
MKPISQTIIAVAVVAGLTLGAAAVGTAQGKPGGHPAARVRPMGHPSTPSNAAPKPKSETFPRGVAAKLGTTPEAMQSAYETAKAANPKLTRGQFIAANMVAQNLSSKNPAITSAALLSGLQSGKSIGQTLQSLGLSSQEAHDAQRQADRDAKAAERAEDSAEKPKAP